MRMVPMEDGRQTLQDFIELSAADLHTNPDFQAARVALEAVAAVGRQQQLPPQQPARAARAAPLRAAARGCGAGARGGAAAASGGAARGAGGAGGRGGAGGGRGGAGGGGGGGDGGGGGGGGRRAVSAGEQGRTYSRVFVPLMHLLRAVLAGQQLDDNLAALQDAWDSEAARLRADQFPNVTIAQLVEQLNGPDGDLQAARAQLT
jgi:hypothetical protein